MTDPLKGLCIPFGWGTFFGFVVDNSVGSEIQTTGVPGVPIPPPPPPLLGGAILQEAGGAILQESGDKIDTET